MIDKYQFYTSPPRNGDSYVTSARDKTIYRLYRLQLYFWLGRFLLRGIRQCNNSMSRPAAQA